MNLQQKIIATLKKGEGHAARVLDSLPTFIQLNIPHLLSSPYHYPNLDPFFQSLMAIQQKQGYKGFISQDINASRNQFEKQMRALANKETFVHHVKDIKVQLENDVIALRHYHPQPLESLPMVVFYHGGGFVVGSINTHDEVCRLLSIHANVQVISVEYPRAPEASPTKLIQACEDVLQWVFQNRNQFNISAQGIAVAGDSAGGNIATVVAQRAKEKKYAPQAQLLIYPVIDSKQYYPSKSLYKEGLVLTGRDLEVATQYYVYTHQAQLDDPIISPIFGELENLAPTFLITAGHDILHDEGVAYAEALKNKNVDIKYVDYQDQTHGFVNFTFISNRAKQVTIELAQAFTVFWNEHFLNR